jgi:hypothetical protein
LIEKYTHPLGMFICYIKCFSLIYFPFFHHIYLLKLGNHIRYIMHKTYIHRCFVARQPYTI